LIAGPGIGSFLKLSCKPYLCIGFKTEFWLECGKLCNYVCVPNSISSSAQYVMILHNKIGWRKVKIRWFGLAQENGFVTA
jgi:hypothetical protein